MVAETLQIGDHVDEHAAGLGLTLALVEPLDVAVNELAAHIVYAFLHALDLGQQACVPLQDSLAGEGVERLDLGYHLRQLHLHALGEVQIIVHGLLGVFGEVIGDLGDTHDVPQVVVQVRDGPLVGQLTLGGQADEVIHHRLADTAGLVDELVGGLDKGLIPRLKGPVAGAEGIHRHVRQADHLLFQLGDGQGGGGEHTLVQIGLGGRGLLLRDQQLRRLHKPATEGEKGHRADHVEEGVEHGDLGGGGREPPLEGAGHEVGPAEQDNEENDRAQRIEHQVDQPGPAGIGSGGEGGHDSGDAGANVGAQDDKQHLVPPGSDGQPSHRHGDDDRGGGGAGLHQSGEEHADEKQ